MSDKEYLVEIIICSYKDDTHWKGDGQVIAKFSSKNEAEKFVNHLVITSKYK